MNERCGALAAVMTKNLKRWLILVAGWGLVVLGVAGLFLPFLQGLLFLLAGLWILASEYAWARKALQKLRERFPALSNRMDAGRDRARAWLKRISSQESNKSQG